MHSDLLILISEAMVVYALVLLAHSMRHRLGLAHFYALIGGITAVMSWVTDAGVQVQVGEISFRLGSTVFYTALLLSVFVIYVFDGPHATRIAISTIAGVSIMVPLIALVLHFQASLSGGESIGTVPTPSLRINSASVITTICDLIFLAIAWEFLGRDYLKLPLWLRSFLTLLGVMMLDVVLFTTGAFAGSAEYLSIMGGTFISRLLVTLFAFPLLYLYIHWQKNKANGKIENRPVLAILKEVSEIRTELNVAQREIELRREAEAKTEEAIAQLQQALAEVKTLRGYLPTCANCNKIRDDNGDWVQFEQYIQDRSEAKFSHSICPQCRDKLYKHS